MALPRARSTPVVRVQRAARFALPTPESWKRFQPWRVQPPRVNPLVSSSS